MTGDWQAWVGVRYPDGSVERVSPRDGFFYQACVNSHGTSVVYAGAASGPPRVWLSPLGSSGERTALTATDSGARHPVWSWQGDRVAFTSDRNTPGESQCVEDISPQGVPESGNIFVMNPVDGGVAQLTRGPYADQRPTFSPDGNTIVFVSDRDGRVGLWRMSAIDAAEPEPLPYRGFAYRPWFAVGGDALFCFCVIGERHQVCRLGLDDLEPTPLANDDLGRTHGPFADPHGEVLLVHSTRDGDHHELYELPLDGHSMRKIEIDGVDHPMHGTRSRDGVLTFDVLVPRASR